MKGLSELAAYVASRIVWTDWVALFCVILTVECLFADRPEGVVLGLTLAAVCARFPGLKRPKP